MPLHRHRRERRKLYDASGLVDEGPSEGEKQWYDFWRDFYTRVTTDKLDALAAEYRGSAEEEADLRAAYLETKGNMDRLLDHIMHSTAEDEPRFAREARGVVADGSLPRYASFANEPDAKKRRRQAKAAKEAEEAEELGRALGLGGGGSGGGGGDLATAIMARQANRQSGFDALFAKYAGGDENGHGGSGGKKGKGGGGGGGSKGGQQGQFRRRAAAAAAACFGGPARRRGVRGAAAEDARRPGRREAMRAMRKIRVEPTPRSRRFLKCVWRGRACVPGPPSVVSAFHHAKNVLPVWSSAQRSRG